MDKFKRGHALWQMVSFRGGELVCASRLRFRIRAARVFVVLDGSAVRDHSGNFARATCQIPLAHPIFVIIESNDSNPGEESAHDRPFMKTAEPNAQALAVRPA
jgi:hypothetical protein